MEVSDSSARRELELVKKQMRDRENAHERELEGLRENQKDSTKTLEENQAESIKRIKDDSNQVLSDRTKRFNEQYENLRDSYEKTLGEERQENYNKFGKFSSETAREKARDSQIREKQLNDLTESHQKQLAGKNKDTDAVNDKLIKTYEKNRLETQRHYDEKMQEQRLKTEEMNANQNEEIRRKLDDTTRNSRTELAKEKLGADLKYHKLVDDISLDRENVKEGFKTREKQLIDSKTEAEKKVGASGQNTFENYRERVNGELIKTINDNNFYNSKKEQETATSLAKAEAAHYNKEQALQSQLQKVESEMEFRTKAEKDRNQLKQSLDERRHVQDVYLANEQVRQNDQFERETLKSRYQEDLQNLDLKNQKQHSENTQMIREKMNEQELRAANEKKTIERDQQNERTKDMLAANREKFNQANQFTNNINAMNDLRQRQLAAQKAALTEEVNEVRKNAEKKVYDSSAENQFKITQLKDRLSNISTENDEIRRADMQYNDALIHNKANRISKDYANSLEKTKERYDEISAESQNQGMANLVKQRQDMEHEQKMQQLELKNKNRLAIIAYENRITDIKDDNDRTIASLKESNDKLLRDTMKKTKDTLDQERSNHMKELDAKDQVMKEKLRLQEQAFKEEIEKMKRTNELALKKN